MQAFIFAILSYAGWGTGDIFGAMASRKIGGYSTSLWVFVAGLVLFSFYIPFALSELSGLTLGILAVNLFLGIFYLAGNVVYNEALRLSSASLAGTLGSCFTALVVIMSVLFLHESITLWQTAAIFVIFSGIVLVTLDFRDLRKSDLLTDKGVQLAIAAMVCWAVYFTFIKLLVAKIGWFWPNYISFLLTPAVWLYIRIRKIPIVSPLKKGSLVPIIASALLLRGADFSFNYGISHGLTALVAPIAGAYPTLFVLLAFWIFKDPIKRQQIWGIITSVVGIVFLAFVSG